MACLHTCLWLLLTTVCAAEVRNFSTASYPEPGTFQPEDPSEQPPGMVPGEDEEEEADCQGNKSILSVECVLKTIPKQALMHKIGGGIGHILPVIVVVGLVGNTLSLIVMRQPQNRHISCCVHMAVLAVADNIATLISGHYWVRTLGYFGPMFEWECSLMVYVGQSFQTAGILLIIAMTTERFIAVRYPLKSAILCTVYRAKVTSLTLVTIMLVFYIPHLLYTKAVAGGKDCYPYAVKSKFGSIHSVISVCLNSVVPFTLLLILNTLIIATLRRRATYFNQDKAADAPSSGSDVTGRSKEKDKERQLTRMLLLVSFTLLVLTLPQQAKYVYRSVIEPYVTSNPLTYYGEYYLGSIITNRLFFANNSINIFLYCLGGSKFRKDLVDLFVGCCRKTRAPPPTPTSVSAISSSKSASSLSLGTAASEIEYKQ